MRYISSILFCLFLALQLPASGSVLAYWEFDNDATLLNAAVGGSTYNLTQSGSNHAGSTANIATITNPETFNGPDDPGATNAGSLKSTGDGTGYLQAGSGSRTGFNLDGTKWTFEGWLNFGGAGPVYLDVILSSRGANNADQGLMFDIRNTGKFNLYVDLSANGDGVLAQNFVLPDAPINDDFHFALTWDSSLGSNGQFEFFLDGESQNTYDLSYDPALADGGSHDDVYLLGRPSTSSFNGYADEFRLSNTALSSDQFLNAVPEPGTGLLILLGGLMAVWVRRMRRA